MTLFQIDDFDYSSGRTESVGGFNDFLHGIHGVNVPRRWYAVKYQLTLSHLLVNSTVEWTGYQCRLCVIRRLESGSPYVIPDKSGQRASGTLCLISPVGDERLSNVTVFCRQIYEPGLRQVFILFSTEDFGVEDTRCPSVIVYDPTTR